MTQKTREEKTEKAKKSPKGKITIDREICKGCQLCISVCPQHLIAVSDRLNQKGYYPAEVKETQGEEDRKCTGCALCATICPDVAIEVYRE
jgi:2-oxoglutarate ferredoxin oxidoreductase subunit delta